MTRLIATACAAAFAFTVQAAEANSAAARVDVATDPSCRVLRILPSGKRILSPPRAAYRTRGSARGSVQAASASVSGGSSSSVSATASSGGSGYATASSSTRSGRRGRTVTTTEDHNGCTIIIDDRSARGTRR